MRARRTQGLAALIALLVMSTSPRTQSGDAAQAAVAPEPPKLAEYKKEAAASVDAMYDLAQQMVDSVFSFSELGFQEVETQRYLTAILEKEGFTIQRGVAGIPTAWTARFGSSKPLIRPEDTPAIWLNQDTMARYRPELREYYYDPTRYKTYLDQLGIEYPTLRQARD